MRCWTEKWKRHTMMKLLELLWTNVETFTRILRYSTAEFILLSYRLVERILKNSIPHLLCAFEVWITYRSLSNVKQIPTTNCTWDQLSKKNLLTTPPVTNLNCQCNPLPNQKLIHHALPKVQSPLCPPILLNYKPLGRWVRSSEPVPLGCSYIKQQCKLMEMHCLLFYQPRKQKPSCPRHIFSTISSSN